METVWTAIRREAEERSFPPAMRSWNNSPLIICIIWAEIDTVRNKIIEIIARHKVDDTLEICWQNGMAFSATSTAGPIDILRIYISYSPSLLQ